MVIFDVVNYVRMSPKEEIISVIRSLPEEWSREEIEFYIYMKKRIESSVDEIRERHRSTNYEMRHQIEAWKSRLMMRK